MNDATQLFTGKSEKNNLCLELNKHDAKTGCINHALKTLKEIKNLDSLFKDYYQCWLPRIPFDRSVHVLCFHRVNVSSIKLTWDHALPPYLPSQVTIKCMHSWGFLKNVRESRYVFDFRLGILCSKQPIKKIRINWIILCPQNPFVFSCQAG